MKKVVFLFLLLFSASVKADFTEGINYFDNQQYSQAFSQFLPLANKGDERAQYYIAYMYLNGLGVGRDEKKGIEYLKKSVEQEYEKGLSLLAYLHSIGKNVELDKKKALELYQKAADLGDNDALLNLGVIYYTSDGVSQDTEKAIQYFESVDLVTTPIVGRYLADIYQASNDEKLKKKSKDLYLLAASNGDLGSFHSLASIAHSGKEGQKNTEQAVTYYTYAASQGYAPSQYALGILYANGDGVARDIFSSYAWITLAANQGLSQAIEAQKQLEEIMTFSEIDAGRSEATRLQQNTIGKIESPLKDYTLKNTEQPKKKGNSNRHSRRRRR